MSHDVFVLIAITVASLATIFYIPRDKYRLALLSLLAFQTITWAISLVLVQLGVYSFPVREFPHATRGSFLHLFLFYPALYAWFTLLFPNRASLLKRAGHYFVFLSVIVWFEYYMVTYTDLKKFLKYSMTFHIASMYIRFFFYFYICRRYILWMEKKTHLTVEGKRAPE